MFDPQRPWRDGATNTHWVAIGVGHERLDVPPSPDEVANLPRSGHSRAWTPMRAPDVVPLAAWIMWELFFDEPEPTHTHRKDDQRQDPPELKTPPRSR